VTYISSFEGNPDTHLFKPADIKQVYEGKGEFWHNIEAKHCRVRQKNYAALKAKSEPGKGPSLEQMYDVVYVTTFREEKKVFDPVDKLNLPYDKQWDPKIKLPQFLVWNVIVPIFEPSMVWNVDDGKTCHVLIVTQLREDAKQRWLSGNLREGDQLLYNYLYEPNDKAEDDQFNLRHRLKIAPECVSYDPDDNDFGVFMQVPMNTYNGTYVILKKSPSWYIRDKFCLINIDLNIFGKFTKKCMWSTSDRGKYEIADFSMLIEGHAKDNSELPELCICSLRIRCDYYH